MRITNAPRTLNAAKPIEGGKRQMLTTMILILIPTISGVVGQLLLKHGMNQMGALEISLATLPALAWRIATSPLVLIGLSVYMGGVFFWLLALNRAELSFVYPFASLSYVLITLAGWLLFHEQIQPMRWAGILVVCLGLALIFRS